LGELFSTFSWGEARQPESVVGGRCQYRQYRGTAEIVSVRRIGETEKGPGEYRVEFVFHSQEEITESFAQVVGTIFPLELNGRDPDELFIEQHGIKTGRNIKCVLKVIVRGTCTPLMFEFPWNGRSE